MLSTTTKLLDKILLHDISSALRSIHSYCQIMSEEFNKRNKKSFLSYLQITERKSKDLMTMIREIHSYSLKSSVYNCYFCLDSLFINVAALFQEDLLKKNLTYQREEMGSIFGDKFVMKHILLNIITNFIKYAPEGDVLKLSHTYHNGNMRINFRNRKMVVNQKCIDGKRQKMGLFLIEELIEKIGGFIRKQEDDQFFCIEISFSTMNDNLNKQTIPDGSSA